MEPQTRRLALPNRIRYPTDCLFASSCSPPHFAMTQLLSATTLWLTPTETFTLLISCPCGRTIACALAQKACREGYTAIYQRLPRLFQELPLAKGDGSYSKLLNRLGKTDVLLLDDWGLAKLSAEQRRDLLEILEDRHGSRSTIVTSQLPLDQWHSSIGDSTLADAIMDRLVHNAYKIKLEGDSLRKQQANLTTTNEIE
jgi:hypothetical protein